MFKKNLFIIMALSLQACSSSPKHKNFLGEGSTCIKGDVANVISFYSNGEAHVKIVEIDGIPTSSRSPYCMQPGNHTFGVSASNMNKNFNNYINIKLEPETNYQLTASLIGLSFQFKLFDITLKNRKEIKEFKLKITDQTSPLIIPIF